MGVASSEAIAADPSDAEKQAELDQRCEAAREKKLAPIREDIYRECLGKKQGDAAYCRRYADDYNGNRVGRSPLFYDLPECEAAFQFRNRSKT
jgi:hypothetical protein